uniref:Uncharacterized protein n=1 Tax=Physcomitrium patens TaxID=3218 RepID=A0A2K1L056_PHYPA|nr:hypothetical protein PHYPA_002195 [Physcomitrium patens]
MEQQQRRFIPPPAVGPRAPAARDVSYEEKLFPSYGDGEAINCRLGHAVGPTWLRPLTSGERTFNASDRVAPLACADHEARRPFSASSLEKPNLPWHNSLSESTIGVVRFQCEDRERG